MSSFFVLCQAERDAQAQALAAVKGLQIRRQGLQAQLQHASPQANPAIIDQIAHISAVELPRAEKALAQAEAALAACLARFTPQGTLTPV
ncbi:MAG: hypothetical protein ABI885_26900 [Gammaproteobacteria bacterium]